jgi:hypothetical protein
MFVIWFMDTRFLTNKGSVTHLFVLQILSLLPASQSLVRKFRDHFLECFVLSSSFEFLEVATFLIFPLSFFISYAFLFCHLRPLNLALSLTIDAS